MQLTSNGMLLNKKNIEKLLSIPVEEIDIPKEFRVERISTNNKIMCLSMHKNITIRADGSIVECSCNGPEHIMIGDINNQNMLEVLNYNRIKKDRKLIEKGEIPLKCNNCFLTGDTEYIFK